MNRSEWLKGVSALGLVSLLSRPRVLSAAEKAAIMQAPSICLLTPQATEGPCYFDPELMRRGVTSETATGASKTGPPLISKSP